MSDDTYLSPSDLIKYIFKEMHNPNRSIEQWDYETVKSLDEYIEKIEIFNKVLEENRFFKENKIFYRGQRSSKWNLLPKICRGRENKDSTQIEEKMLNEFKILVDYKLPEISKEYCNDWDYLALAQHYEMSTRLLDWTKDSLTALWFACFDKFGINNPDEDAVVFIYYADKKDIISPDNICSPYAVESYKVFQPSLELLNDRLQAQAGIFTVHSFNNEIMKFPNFDDYKATNKKIIRLVIDSKYIKKLSYELIEEGYTHSRMFPDLHGICGEVEWKYFILSE